MADGSIVFDTKIDNSGAVKDLKKLNSRIKTLTQQIETKTALKAPIAEQAKQMAAQLDAAKASLEAMKASSGVFTSDQISAQTETVKALQAEWSKIQSRVDSYDNSIKKASAEIDVLKEHAGEIEAEMASAGVNTEKMAKATRRANKGAMSFGRQIKFAMSSILLYGTLFRVFALITEWIGKVIKANDEAAASVAQLKGAFLTMIQPILSIVIPVFIVLVQVLTKVVSAIAQLFAMLTGTTIEASKEAADALNQEIEALEGTGAAADDASKSLASFDEINKLSGSSVSSGGAAADTGIQPDFNFESDFTESQLNKIFSLVTAIGTAFLTWKISRAFEMNLFHALGLALAIYSAFQLVKNLFDAWTQGVNWDNLIGALLSTVGLVTGLAIAFGSVGAGIGAIVSGIGLIATGFYDAMVNGWSLQNALMAIAGIIATGLGISLLTGSWIPLLIGGIASVLLAFTIATGHGEELLNGLRTVLEGFSDFFTGIFTGDLEKALVGIDKIFEGLSGIVTAVFSGIEDTIGSFFNWLDEKTGGQFTTTIRWIENIFKSTLGVAEESLRNFLSAFEEIFEGITTFLSGVFTQDWDMAWDGLVQIGKGAINLLISMVESFVNFWINGLNTLIKALNSISFDAPEWLGGGHYGINIPLVPNLKIPRLAQGAVIPPNREFLAVLGDQKNGTNIETPLSTMVQAFRQAMSEMGYGGQGEAVLEVDGQQFGKLVYKYNNKESRRVGVRLAEV